PRLEGFPSITRIKVASDLSTADVFVTIMGTEGKQTAALNALKHSAGMMRQKLQKSLPMRTIPFLKFHLDEALRKEIQVLELIDKAVNEENELRGNRPGDDKTQAHS
ncbi:MAG: 30S ribosome-binding factor RbfA, partial [Tepidisphaeraceae bacterium]